MTIGKTNAGEYKTQMNQIQSSPTALQKQIHRSHHHIKFQGEISQCKTIEEILPCRIPTQELRNTQEKNKDK